MTAPLPRSAGVLLHPSSLPGPFGVGDLGPAAVRWVETLAAAKQSWWQILPLGPTGFGDSPYQCFSAFAGNVNLLSPELLERDGLVNDALWAGQRFDDDRADFDRVAPFKAALLRAAWDGFRGGRAPALKSAFEAFRESEKAWLTDYARFMAFRDALGGAQLPDWPTDLRTRVPAAVAATETELDGEIRRHEFGQFLFARQWAAVKTFAAEKRIRIIGDIPIFVSADSADVWANPDQFLLGPDGVPTVVAGVPPDYFAEDGQHWGNPIYDWPAMAADGFRWWCARVKHALTQADLLRLDHFRGFAQAWHIPAGEPTARNGTWVDGPGAQLFAVLRGEVGLPFIAEDLGLITPDVDALRTAFGLPGMKVLQFGMGGDPKNQYLPHNYTPATAVYTGTHDNDTTLGWYRTLDDAGKQSLREYIGHDVHDPAWELIRLAWASVAAVAVTPLQDVLGCGGDARMNVPGQAAGNWRWRFRPDHFRPGVIERLADMTVRYNRAVPEPEPVSPDAP